MEGGGRRTHLGHATVDDEVSAVYEAAFVAGEEEHRLRLLNSFAETAGGEVDFASVALGSVVAEPVLEEGGAVRRLLADNAIINYCRRERRSCGQRGSRVLVH